MPRKTVAEQCVCCSMTKAGVYLPGHDAKTLPAIIEHVGGEKQLQQLVEGLLKQQIEVNF